MRILLINKFHSRLDGAARAYFDTAEILVSHGHEVAFFAMRGSHDEPTIWSKYFVDPVDYHTSHSIAEKMRMVKDIWWNCEAQKKLEALIDEFHPDVAHLHVIYHQLSPSIIATLKNRGVPMVMTLHDYKLICPNYSMYVREHIWEGGAFRCILDRCVKDSLLKSWVCAIESVFHRLTGIYKKVDVYISPSQFLIQKFQEHAFSKGIRHIPQPIFKKDQLPITSYNPNGHLFYSGSLTTHKGIAVLLRVMTLLPNERLHIAGDGPEKKIFVEMAKKLGITDRILFLGHLDQTHLQKEISEAKLVLVPSIWYENMPYSLLEALSAGKIVIASKLGGISERISDGVNGFLVNPGDVKMLAKTIQDVSKKNIHKMQEEAQKSVLDLSPDFYYKELFSIYNELTFKK